MKFCGSCNLATVSNYKAVAGNLVTRLWQPCDKVVAAL